MSGLLYVVATPIGNPEDITARALATLAQADAVVCEEYRVGSTLLSHYGIEKPLVEINEHNESDQVPILIDRMEGGEKLALISDHGTPLVADPGYGLVARAIRSGIRVVPVPGASSVVAALVASGLPAQRFRFLGQLPPKTETRRQALRSLKAVTDTMVMLDAPYRLLPLLKSIRDELGSDRMIAVACNLTLADEQIVRGAVGDVVQHFTDRPFKGEFVITVEGARRLPRQQRS